MKPIRMIDGKSITTETSLTHCLIDKTADILHKIYSSVFPLKKGFVFF